MAHSLILLILILTFAGFATASNTCTLAYPSTGYVTSACNALSGGNPIADSDCTLSCDGGYTSSSTPTVTCTTDAGTFTIADPCQAASANTCTLPDPSTGYVTTRCDRLGVGGEEVVAWWVGWLSPRGSWPCWASNLTL